MFEPLEFELVNFEPWIRKFEIWDPNQIRKRISKFLEKNIPNFLKLWTYLKSPGSDHFHLKVAFLVAEGKLYIPEGWSA